MLGSLFLRLRLLLGLFSGIFLRLCLELDYDLFGNAVNFLVRGRLGNVFRLDFEFAVFFLVATFCKSVSINLFGRDFLFRGKLLFNYLFVFFYLRSFILFLNLGMGLFLRILIKIHFIVRLSHRLYWRFLRIKLFFRVGLAAAGCLHRRLLLLRR